MPYGGAYLLAAAFRSIGFDAWLTSDSDARTLELGGKYTSGDECYPQKHRRRRLPAAHRGRTSSIPRRPPSSCPSANGPCRFGQYAGPDRRRVDELGYDDVRSSCITSADGYAGIGDYSRELIRTAWRAVVIQDILMKLLLMTRPYEIEKGSTDALYKESLVEVGEASACRGSSTRSGWRLVVGLLGRARDRFRAMPADYRRGRPSSASSARSSAASTPSPTTT